MLTQTIEIQVNNPGLIPQINAIQADSGRTLDCIISDMAIPAGATARIYAQKPSGAKVFNNCAISDRTVSVDLTTQILAELGRTVCQVQITQGTEKVTSFDFIINVIKSRIDSTAIESTDEFTALDEALAQADALLDNLANQPITFTEATTVSELESGDTIAELFGQLKKNIEDGLFGTEDIIPVANGGTGATTQVNAADNLGVYSLVNGIAIAANSDLNDIVEPGNYKCTNVATVATFENCPTTQSFKMYVSNTVLFNGGTYRTQEIYDLDGDKYERHTANNGTDWSNWNKFAFEENTYALLPSARIQSGDDLNDYTDYGCWLCASSTITATLSNCPFTGGGFSLRVLAGTWASTGTYKIQEIIRWDGKRHYRDLRAGTWYEWKTTLTDEDTIPIENGGTGATTAAAAIRNLAFLGVSPISSPSEDLPAAWTALGTGIAYINASGKLTSQPGTYGFVLNFTYSNIVYQLWLSMNGGSAIYARSGNAGSWYSSSANWVQVSMSAVEAANYVTYDELATAIREGVNSYGV